MSSNQLLFLQLKSSHIVLVRLYKITNLL